MGPADGGLIIAIAEKFGQLPDTIERDMSEFWFNRVVVQMEGEAMNAERQERDRRKSR